jgi:hypothetical protein
MERSWNAIGTRLERDWNAPGTAGSHLERAVRPVSTTARGANDLLTVNTFER